MPAKSTHKTATATLKTGRQAGSHIRFFHLASPRYLQKFVFIIADFIRFFNCFYRGRKVTLFHNYVLFHILDTAFFTGKNRTEMYLFQCISIRFIITLLIKPCLILQIIQRLSPRLSRLLCQLLQLQSRQRHLLLQHLLSQRHRCPRTG